MSLPSWNVEGVADKLAVKYIERVIKQEPPLGNLILSCWPWVVCQWYKGINRYKQPTADPNRMIMVMGLVVWLLGHVIGVDTISGNVVSGEN